MTLDELILEQQEAAKQAAFYSKRDKELRALIYGMAFAGLDYGTQHNTPLGKGYFLKGKRPVNYKVDPNTVDAALDELSQLGNEGSFVADRVIKWSPELSLTEYKNLTAEQKAIVDKVITTTPGLPTLEVVAPKEGK
jgi:hypothetical protein